jgi:hypothetical protein
LKMWQREGAALLEDAARDEVSKGETWFGFV